MGSGNLRVVHMQKLKATDSGSPPHLVMAFWFWLNFLVDQNPIKIHLFLWTTWGSGGNFRKSLPKTLFEDDFPFAKGMWSCFGGNLYYNFFSAPFAVELRPWTWNPKQPVVFNGCVGDLHPIFSMVVKAGLLFRLPGKVWTQLNSELLQLLGVGPFVENLPVAGLNEEDLREAVRERLREDYADVFGDRERDQKRRRPRRTTAMAAVFQVLVFNIIGNNQGLPKRWFTVGIYIYIFIIHYYTWYIIYSFFMKGALLTFAVHCFAVFWQDPSHPRYCIADSVACWLVWAKSI